MERVKPSVKNNAKVIRVSIALDDTLRVDFGEGM